MKARRKIRLGKDFWIFSILCGLAFCARFFIAPGQSLWTDEIAGALMSDRGAGGIIGVVALFDVNPPLSYFFIRLALLFGRSDAWLRVPFEILGALSCGFLFLLFRRAGMKKPWLAGVLLAMMPMHIYLSQEIRHYALSSLLSILWAFTLLSFEENPKKSRGTFILVRLLGVLNHYYFFTLFFVDWAYLVWRRRKDVLKKLLWYQILVGIYFSPWLPALFHQISARTYQFRVGVAPQKLLADLVTHIFFYAADSPEPSIVAWSRTDPLSSLVLLAVPFVFVMLAGLRSFAQTERARKLAISWLVAPVFFVALLAWKVPLYQHRYFVIVLGAACGLLALGLENLSKLRRWVAIAFGGLCVFTWAVVLYEYHADSAYQRENWRAFATYLGSQPHSKRAGILTYTSDAAGPLGYYYNGEMKVLLAIPSKGFEFGKYDTDVIANRLRAIGNLDEIYFVDHYPHMFDPKGVVSSWLYRRYHKVDDFWDGFRIRGGRYVKGGKDG